MSNLYSPSPIGVGSALRWTVYEAFPISPMVIDPAQPSRSVNLHFADIRPMGTLAHFTGGGDDCSLGLRIVLETQAAFWGLAYRLAQPLADPVVIATTIWANRPLIQVLLDRFRADDGSEHFGGAPVDAAPPGYTGMSPPRVYNLILMHGGRAQRRLVVQVYLCCLQPSRSPLMYTVGFCNLL